MALNTTGWRDLTAEEKIDRLATAQQDTDRLLGGLERALQRIGGEAGVAITELEDEVDEVRRALRLPVRERKRPGQRAVGPGSSPAR